MEPVLIRCCCICSDAGLGLQPHGQKKMGPGTFFLSRLVLGPYFSEGGTLKQPLVKVYPCSVRGLIS